MPAPPPADGPVAVRISALDLSGSPRLTGCDADHVRALAEADPAGLPPIVVHRATMKVLDGVHRVQAAVLRGESEIRAELLCGPEKESFVHAVRANTAHGLPLSLEDRKAAALRILREYPHCSDRSLGDVAGLSARTIARLRRSTANGPRSNDGRLGRDGRVRPASTAEGRLRAGHLLREHPGASLRDVAHRAGISLGTAQDVSRRLRSGLDPLPDRLRADAAAVRGRPEAHARAAAPEAPRPPEGLAFLRQDPALRSSDAGRALIRLLSAHEAVLATGAGPASAAAVPPHCVPAAAEAARACARAWARFADELARREP
ncbi:hypothetical protein AC230_23735 [Streptomyces caatingaensis]|uniref:ParB-like N-terminal domain-containing protein n=1 Tax=Streptomyces caatingaensis TaxID=1678637 RepID=A0A0K9XCC7_9ACTN|nr:hypothetical protein AC230_23735 [Streptomyces caatingaensis]